MVIVIQQSNCSGQGFSSKNDVSKWVTMRGFSLADGKGGQYNKERIFIQKRTFQKIKENQLHDVIYILIQQMMKSFSLLSFWKWCVFNYLITSSSHRRLFCLQLPRTGFSATDPAFCRWNVGLSATGSLPSKQGHWVCMYMYIVTGRKKWVFV